MLASPELGRGEDKSPAASSPVPASVSAGRSGRPKVPGRPGGLDPPSPGAAPFPKGGNSGFSSGCASPADLVPGDLEAEPQVTSAGLVTGHQHSGRKPERFLTGPSRLSVVGILS